MGTSISCHQPCCRWTTDVDGELSVAEGKRLAKPGEEEPKMNFDTNVIGPPNINLIGGGSGNGLQLQQELKLFEDSRYSRQRESSRGKSPKAETEKSSPAAKASSDVPKCKETSAKAGSPSRAQGSTVAVTQSAKQFADAFSREVTKIDRERVNKQTKPRFQDSIRIMPTSAWSKLYAGFPPRATSPVKKASEVASEASVSPTAPAPPSVQKELHSIVPAQWSSFHRHWTGQKTVAEMVIAIPEIQSSQVVICPSVAQHAKEAVAKQISMALSSAGPAMWSPLHRKWCGSDGLKNLKPSTAALQKLVLAKNCGVLPGLASSMLDAALNIEVKAAGSKAAKAAIKDEEVKAGEVLKSAPQITVKCSVAPAMYSKWHRHWTGVRAR